jgi:hypothetical protein
MLNIYHPIVRLCLLVSTDALVLQELIGNSPARISTATCDSDRIAVGSVDGQV